MGTTTTIQIQPCRHNPTTRALCGRTCTSCRMKKLLPAATLNSVSSASAFRDCCVLRPPKDPSSPPGGEGLTKTFTKEVYFTFLCLVFYQAQYYHSYIFKCLVYSQIFFECSLVRSIYICS